VLDTNKLYKQLKNGKRVQLFYKQSELRDYTLWLTFADKIFKLHSFHFAGNDVFNDSNYQDEQIETFENFEPFIDRLNEKFPDITYH